MKLELSREVCGTDKCWHCTPYDHPEHYGLEKIAELEWDNESYSFAMTAVLRRKSDGTLWTADDAGCSCPSPFDGTWDWERVFNTDAFRERYRLKLSEEYSYGHTKPNEFEAFLAAVEQALKEIK